MNIVEFIIDSRLARFPTHFISLHIYNLQILDVPISLYPIPLLCYLFLIFLIFLKFNKYLNVKYIIFLIHYYILILLIVIHTNINIKLQFNIVKRDGVRQTFTRTIDPAIKGHLLGTKRA